MIETIIDGQPAILPALYCELPGERIGWYQRGEFDCLQAAAATALQAPYEALENVNTLRKLEEFAELNGFTVDVLLEGPPDADSLWLGKTAALAKGLRHVLVCRGEEVFHDPAAGWVFPGGHPITPREIDYGVLLTPKERA